MIDIINMLNKLQDQFIKSAEWFREDAKDEVGYRVYVKLVHDVGSVRNVLVRDHLAGMEKMISEALPDGATPTISWGEHTPESRHPSTQPPDQPRLSVVKNGDPDET